jgi:hypothetical protein
MKHGSTGLFYQTRKCYIESNQFLLHLFFKLVFINSSKTFVLKIHHAAILMHISLPRGKGVL